jgi:hypothetical protein
VRHGIAGSPPCHHDGGGRRRGMVGHHGWVRKHRNPQGRERHPRPRASGEETVLALIVAAGSRQLPVDAVETGEHRRQIAASCRLRIVGEV